MNAASVTMNAIKLSGRINDDGEVEVEGQTGMNPGARVQVIVIAEEALDQPLTWGQEVLALLTDIDTSAWNAPEFDDAAEWVHKLRHGQPWGQE